jgi:hypothetical protein
MRLPLAAVLLATFAQATLAQSEPNDWTGYRNERFGFFLRYPANVLRPEKSWRWGGVRVERGRRAAPGRCSAHADTERRGDLERRQQNRRIPG